MVEKIESDLDILNELIEWSGISNRLSRARSDYSPLSLCKALLLQTRHQLSDAGMSQELRRDLACMKFAGFALEGNKSDSAAICQFRNHGGLDSFTKTLRVLILLTSFDEDTVH